MPYKVTGLQGLAVDGLSLKAAREMVRRHLEKPEFSDLPTKSEVILANGKVVFELHYFMDADTFQDMDTMSMEPLEVARIEYVKGGDDALPRNHP
jgi:hypothetical protein